MSAALMLRRGAAGRGLVVVAVAVAAAVIAWLYWQQHRARPLVVSGFVEADQIRVGSRVGGRVSEVIAEEGRHVKSGEILYRIDPFDLQERLAEGKAELARADAEYARLKAGYRVEEIAEARAKRDQAAATLDKLKAGPRKQEIEKGRAALAARKADQDLAETEYGRVMRLKKESTAAQIEVDRVERAMKATRADVDAAEQDLKLLEEGTRKEDIAAAVSALAQTAAAAALLEAGYRAEDVAQAAAMEAAAKAKVAALEVQVGELDVRAPVDSVVEAIDLRPGDLVAANAPSASLLDEARYWVRTYVPESRLGRVRLDQVMMITCDSFPGEQFKGHVTFVASEAEFTPRNIQTPEERSKQVFRLKVTLDEGRDKLRVGMPVDVHLPE